MSDRDAVVSLDRVESLILSIRGRRVILDSDLARLYGVTTARLNEQVKRNPDRFPPDFMFPLSRQEFTALISQNATSKGRGGRRKLPNVFTEHGAIMAGRLQKCSRPKQAPAPTLIKRNSPPGMTCHPWSQFPLDATRERRSSWAGSGGGGSRPLKSGWPVATQRLLLPGLG